MAQTVKYERLSTNEVKIIYQSDGKSTEVVARVVKPGSYDKCEVRRGSETKRCANEED
jgi:hypothetical protein